MSSPVICFPAADRQQWQDLVRKVLQGKTLDSLNRIDEDGLEIAVLYQVEKNEALSSDSVPIHRLPVNSAHRLEYGWQICQPIYTETEPETVNKNILEELEGGSSAIYLTINSLTERKLEFILSNVFLEAVDIVLDAGTDVCDVLPAFERIAQCQDRSLSELGLNLGIDPFAPNSETALLSYGVDLLRDCDKAKVPDRIFQLNGWRWHNQGMSQVQELAYLLAGATEIFRSGLEAGLSAAEIAKKISMTVALPADFFDGVSKCRALRRGWAGLVNALGLDVNKYRLHLQAMVSMRMFSVIEPDNNVLRTTTALLGGAMGGADMMTSFAHDSLTGASVAGRRLARMQQVMMIEESGLGYTIDPTGGAAFIESRTEALANASWSAFQDIEFSGGASQASVDKKFEEMAYNSSIGRDQRLLCGKSDLLGVTIHAKHEPTMDVIARWQDVRRPAAIVELMRQKLAKHPPRILILQKSDEPNTKLQSLNNLLNIGGVSALQLRLPTNPIDAIEVACPTIVILLDLKIGDLDPMARDQLRSNILSGSVYEADEILKNENKMEWLRRLSNLVVVKE